MEIKHFNLKSIAIIENDKQTFSLNAKGYKKEDKETILYFKDNDNKYKFYLNKDNVKVEMNESKYEFDLNKDTNCLIKNSNLEFKAKIHTIKLEIADNGLSIDYQIDFKSFKGNYNIKLNYD